MSYSYSYKILIINKNNIIKNKKYEKERRDKMISLVKPSKKYQEDFESMLEEIKANGDKVEIDSIKRYTNYEDFLKRIYNEERDIDLGEREVPSTTYFVYDSSTDQVLGVVNIKHLLTRSMYLHKGHIKLIIRPLKRRIGHGTNSLKLALEECKKLKIDKVILVTDKDNIPAVKTIKGCNPLLLEETVIDEDFGWMEQRYMIAIR